MVEASGFICVTLQSYQLQEMHPSIHRYATIVSLAKSNQAADTLSHCPMPIEDSSSNNDSEELRSM